MVVFNHEFGTYRYVNPLDSSWGVESIYVLCNAKDVYGVRGELEKYLFS